MLGEEDLIEETDVLYLKMIALELKMDPRFGPEHPHIIFLITSLTLPIKTLEEKRVEFRNYAAAELPDSIVSAISIPFSSITIIPDYEPPNLSFFPQPSAN